MFDPVSFVRTAAFAILYGGIEYRYVNRREADWTMKVEGFFEKPALWKLTPYHLYLLLPVFVIVSYGYPATAWGGNLLLVMVGEDVAYFVWRGRWVAPGEWTTTLLGSFRLGRFVVPAWWVLGVLGIVALYLVRH